jgi:hypothetical protein
MLDIQASARLLRAAAFLTHPPTPTGPPPPQPPIAQTAVSLFGAMVRSLLHKYRGYECKEPEAGKFTLAFQ